MQVIPLLAALLLEFLALTPPERTLNGQPRNLKPAAEAHVARVQKEVEGDPRYWTAPYVLADKTSREVIVWGQMSGVAPGDILEFFAVADNSGHDYEALLLCFAKPSDIHQALEVIGLHPGGGVNPATHRFWPRGDRVVAELELTLPGAQAPRRLPIEQFITRPDGTGMTPLPWVFTGSPIQPSTTQQGTLVYAADEFSPNSIASAFNLTHTVFDLPLQGGKTHVYGQYKRNPALPTPEGTPVLLRLRPATVQEAAADVDLLLTADPRGLVLHLEEGPRPLEPEQLPDLLKARPNETHFLTLDFAPDLPLSRLVDVSQALLGAEKNIPSLRIEPPPPGQLFFQAFVPDPRYRVREDRPSQPLELHLRRSPDKPTRADLLLLEEVWGDSSKPTVLETRKAFDEAADWQAWISTNSPPGNVLFLYAPPETLHSELLEWTKGLQERFPVIFVYLEE